MPLSNDDVADQVTGSTFFGIPDVVGGVYYTSGAAYIQTIQVDPSGSVYVTTSGSLPVFIQGGTVETEPQLSHVATETAFTASLSSQLLAATNTSRVGISVFNDPGSTGYLYLRLYAAATTSSYSTVLWPGSYWEAPYGYLGTVYGVFTSTTGSCLVTEYT
jgi:hypothetical protein